MLIVVNPESVHQSIPAPPLPRGVVYLDRLDENLIDAQIVRGDREQDLEVAQRRLLRAIIQERIAVDAVERARGCAAMLERERVRNA